MPGDIYVNAQPLTVDPNAIATTIPAGDSLSVLDQALAGANGGNASSSPVSSINVLDQALSGKLATAPKAVPKPPATASSVAANAAAGANEGAIDVLGMPVDATAWLINKGIQGVNAVTGANVPTIENPIGGSQSIKNALGAVNPRLSPDTVVANQPIERIARGLGSGAAAAGAPEAMVGGLGAAGLAALYPRTAQFFQNAFGSGSSIAQTATNAAVGALGGGTGEGAAEVVPPPLKPIARFAGNLAGGGVGALGAEAPTLAQSAVKAARDYAAPMQGATKQAELAQRTFSAGVQNRQQALDALQNGSGVGVGGVPQTTYQATGDLGIGSMEREAETAAPTVFNERRAQQNEARVGAIRNLQPTGDPSQVAAELRDQLAELDDMTAGIQRQATVKAQNAVSGIGGNTTPEAVGAQARQHLADANTGAKAWESALWQAVDPEGKLALGAAPITAGARRIEGEVAKSAKPMEGEEGRIFEAAKALEAVSSLKEITALRSRISEEMRNQRGPQGSAQSLARLTQLRGVVEQAIVDAAEHQAGAEAVAVKTGAIKPEESMAARLQAEADEFRRIKAEAAGANAGGNSASTSRGSTGGVRGADGTEVQGSRGSGNPSGSTGVPEANFDADAARRIKEASAATKERAQTFKQGPVGEALAERGNKGDYRLLDSSVGAKFWKPGSGGAEAVKAYGAATGNAKDAVGTLENVAALSLRRAAMREDGTLDPAKFDAWSRSHQDALRALGEVSKAPGRFADAARASEAVADATAMRSAALDAYQKTAVAPFLKATDAGDVTKQIGAIFGGKNAIQTMRQLSAEVANTPDARDGLRKGIADYIAARFIGNTEQVKSDTFQSFLRQSKPVLAQVFDHAELKGMEAVASELSRNKALADMQALPARSTTAQDTIHALNKAGEGGHMSLFAEMMLGAGAGFEAQGARGAVAGAAAAIAKNRLNAMRAAGLENVRDLVREMLLNPQLAREALEKVGPEKVNSRDIRFTQQLNRVAAVAATRMIAKKQDEKARK